RDWSSDVCSSDLVFLTPDQKPFYGGTYYPPQSWEKLLRDIAHTYKVRRSELEASAHKLTKHLAQSDVERFRSQAKATELAHDLDAITEIGRASCREGV